MIRIWVNDCEVWTDRNQRVSADFIRSLAGRQGRVFWLPADADPVEVDGDCYLEHDCRLGVSA